MSIIKSLTFAAFVSLAYADGPGRHHSRRPKGPHPGGPGPHPAPSCTTKTSTTCTETLCADYVATCGSSTQWYGSCFPDCSGYTWPSISSPPCTLTTPTTTPPGPTTTSDCTVCYDYINSCGQTYGGCIGCTVSPSFTDPGCPTTTTSPPTTTPPIGTITPINTCTQCVDYINSCGQTYGGCFNRCTESTPSFTDPGCPTTITTPPVTTTTSPTSTFVPNTCYQCVDYVNSCGQTYGGCFNPCTESTPSFTDPGCPTTTPPVTTNPPTSTFVPNTCYQCVDYVNSCGQTYGGCFNPCTESTPSFTDPGCPTTTPA